MTYQYWVKYVQIGSSHLFIIRIVCSTHLDDYLVSLTSALEDTCTQVGVVSELLLWIGNETAHFIRESADWRWVLNKEIEKDLGGTPFRVHNFKSF